MAARLRACSRAWGFTIVELMVTLAVAAILAMIALPSFKHIIASTNLSNINNDLAGDLQYARTEAVSRQVQIGVAASSGNWQDGWKVQVQSSGSVLRVHSAIAPQYAVKAGAVTQVAFEPQGSLVPPSGSTAASTTCITIAAVNGEHNTPHYLQVLPAGMLKQTTSTSPPSSSCPTP